MTTSTQPTVPSSSTVEPTTVDTTKTTEAPQGLSSSANEAADVVDGSHSQPRTDADQATSTQAKLDAEKAATTDAAKPQTSDEITRKDDATAPPSKEKEADDDAIGPAQEDIGHAQSSGADAAPVCSITLLLTSGSRHPYRISAKYLNRRNVSMPDETENGHPDPFSISIYTLKELILREWRSDWEAKPASPSSIRLIHFGKLLDDKEQLKSMYNT